MDTTFPRIIACSVPGLLCAFGVWAADTPAPAAPAPYNRLPRVEPANALAGAALVDALRQGGFVIYMRHARYAMVTEQCTEPNLDAEGEAMAKQVGVALRERRIPFGSVRTSPLCRAIETAKLLEVGPAEIDPVLRPAENDQVALHTARQKLFTEMPKQGTNTLLISHLQYAKDPSLDVSADLCELVVFKPDGKGGTKAVARIRPEDWAGLPR